MSDENRRYSDSHPTPCPALDAHVKTAELIYRDTQELKKLQTDIVEMLKTWNDAKGFVTTMKSIGSIVLWIVAIGAAISMFSEGVRHWLFQK